MIVLSPNLDAIASRISTSAKFLHQLGFPQANQVAVNQYIMRIITACYGIVKLAIQT
jgi:hypothetical protein